MGEAIDRIGLNDAIFAKIIDEPAFQSAVKDWIMRPVYRKFNNPDQLKQ
ncbi:MAG: hypothetical protein K6T63_13370 [Alicyclobacillus herbarius]|nr:hypothetical protein [Alicyclobacillus herbarius]MCL6633608.1 hypothetical protein [Alicyclobacillus herbarius]